MMKKSSTAVILFVCLLITIGCSSSGTISVHDLQPAKAAKYLGQNVVVVGSADIKTPGAPARMFRLTDKYEYIWVERPESASEPPQGYQVRVTGTLQKKQTNIFGEVYCVVATKVEME
jgi:hypothetical protein